MSGPPPAPGGVRRAGRAGRKPRSASARGALTQSVDANNDTWWEFVGNGETTGTEVIERTLEHEVAHGEESLRPLLGDRPFAQHAASQLLGVADTPIPADEVHEFGLKDLLGLVEPFLRAYAAQAGARERTAGGPAQDQDRVIGNVNSQGLALPLDL